MQFNSTNELVHTLYFETTRSSDYSIILTNKSALKKIKKFYFLKNKEKNEIIIRITKSAANPYCIDIIF